VPPSQDPARRAVVTAVGAVTPIGNDFETYWTNLRNGVSGVGPITSFDATGYEVRIAAEVKDFNPGAHMDPRMARRMSRVIHLAMAAGKEAVVASGIDFAAKTEDELDRVAMCIFSAGGGLDEVVDGSHIADTKGPSFVSPFAVPALSASMAGCLMAIELKATGPVHCQSAACATSILAFQDALRLIQSGEIDVVLAGGVEAPILPIGVAALANMGALSRRNDEPEKACRPFDRDRDGFVLGEGAGVVVVESLAHALARGATPIAEILGGATTADAFHIAAPEPTGRGAARAMTLARQHAGIAADEVDWILAHGTSTSLNDVTETRAIKTSFGAHAYKLAVSSPKSMVGHLVGGAGVINAMAAIGGIRDGFMSPTLNLDNPDLPECDLDYVPKVGRKAKVETVATNGFGFGGQNATTIFRKYTGA